MRFEIRFMLRLAFVMILLWQPTGAPAQTPVARAGRIPLLVSVEWLATRAPDERLVLLHVGTKSSYETAHLPGARHAFLMDLHSWTDVSLEMLPSDQLRERLAGLGISDDSSVVVYSAGGPVYSAARVVLLLQHAGLRDVALLQGGLNAWVAAGHKPTTTRPAAVRGSLSPLRTGPLIIDAEGVRRRLGRPGVAVVDTRAQAFYDGLQTGGDPAQPHRAGHISGAISIPFSALEEPAGVLKPVEELRAVFARAGVREGDVVIAYCHVGQQASSLVFAAQLLGHEAWLYDGSFEDWSRRGLPVQTPGTGGR